MGKRGPKPKPIEEHIASGATRKNPKRFAARLAELTARTCSIQPPADFLYKSPMFQRHLEIWNEFVAELGSRLASSDRYLLGLTVRAYYNAERPGATHSQIGRAADLLAKIGLTPATRSPGTSGPIRSAESEDQDDFAEFVQ